MRMKPRPRQAPKPFNREALSAAKKTLWTTDKPTKEGWYWARTSGKPVDETEIVRLTWMRGIDDQADAQDALVVHFNPGGWPFAHDVMKGIPLDELEGEWYGPLEVPE